MGFKASSCTVCAVMSMLGFLFYLTCVFMVYNDNDVFLEHKVGFVHHDMTAAQYKTYKDEKIFRIGMTSLCMFASMNFCFWRASIFKRDDSETSYEARFTRTHNAQIVFES